MSVITAGTTLTTAFQVTGDTNGNLVIKTGASGTTALTIGADQVTTFANPPTITGGALPVASGGTGLTSTPTNGQIDIGNGTGFTRATITAGSGISVTNGAGSITIAASSTGGAQDFIVQSYRIT